jgi:hypothetical protein
MSYQNQLLGTIVASILNYDQLCQSMGENPAFTPAISSYAPCDGRSIAGSKLARVIDKAMLPDLRGKFLRGVNLIYNIGQPPGFDPNIHGDTQPNRLAGTYQADSLKKHYHSVGFNEFKYTNNNGGNKSNSVAAGTSIATSPAGDNDFETRPRNVAVYYYIKIN